MGPYGFHEGEKRGAIKGKLCAAASVGVSWVGHGGELRSVQVVAVHGDEGGNASMLGVEAIDYNCCEGGFTYVSFENLKRPFHVSDA